MTESQSNVCMCYGVTVNDTMRTQAFQNVTLYVQFCTV